MTTSRCVFAAEIPIEANKSCPLHNHTCTELVYYSQGSGQLLQNGARIAYKTGDLSVNAPKVEHSDHPETDGLQFCFGISGCYAEQLSTGIYTDLSHETTQAILQLQRELHASTPRKQARLDILAGWITLNLLDTLNQCEAPSEPKDQSKRAREILDTRYHETISMDDLAGSLHISADHLRHIFKRDIGKSPINYLIQKRIDVACELLTFTDHSIQEIAKQVGLENPYYFSRIFRNRMSSTPSQYRKDVRSGMNHGAMQRHRND
ncbi:AraC family transcriptional regulator [Coraliomargarita algicola]|uniref:AraC family transcriptional regulator n=1 Tax=Coraliomargarita algicola TaxID=3092156 RepID=A0ABZ0RLC0_9BACT|nr:AraC family transcriptional regulator [Coraliomargarita sp. J2-16]WPJ95570.1 AraC family transcriptional regulator [Coraliomargarita sp. J2-16]